MTSTGTTGAASTASASAESSLANAFSALHSEQRLLDLPPEVLNRILVHIAWTDLVAFAVSCKRTVGAASFPCQEASQRAVAAWGGSLSHRPFHLPRDVASWVGSPHGQSSRISSVLVYLPFPEHLERPDPLSIRVCRMLGSGEYAAWLAERGGPSIVSDYFPGVPDSVWLPQLEQLLGLDFTDERAVALGEDLVWEEVTACGLSREELNGVRGNIVSFDAKRGRCVVRFDGHDKSMLVRPANLQRCNAPDPLVHFLRKQPERHLITDRLKLDSLGPAFPSYRFEPNYFFNPMDSMRCVCELHGHSNKLDLQKGGGRLLGCEHFAAMFEYEPLSPREPCWSYGEENEDLEDEGAPEEPEVQVIFPLEINFPGGSRTGGDGIFFILRAYRWRPRVGEGVGPDCYRSPVKFAVSDSSCYDIAFKCWEVMQREVD